MPSTSGTIWRWGLIAGGIVGLFCGLVAVATLYLPGAVRVWATALSYLLFIFAAALAGFWAGMQSRHGSSGPIAGVTVAVVASGVSVLELLLSALVFGEQVSPKALGSILSFGVLLVVLGAMLGTIGGLVGWLVVTRAGTATPA